MAGAGQLIIAGSETVLWVAAAIVALYLVLSVVAFVMYAVDKSAARSAGRRRIPERTLLVVSVLGGWPGSIVAQRTFRHKTRKASFRRAFLVTMVINIAVVGAVAVLQASNVLDALQATF